MGFSEAITFAFIDTAAAAAFAAPGDGAGGARQSAVREVHDACARACCRGWSTRSATIAGTAGRTCGCSRSAPRFSRHGETRGAAIAWTGLATPEHWSGGQRDVDFFDVKGVAEQLCGVMGVSPAFVATSRPYLVDGRVAEVHVDGTAIGVVGQLDPAIAEARDLPGADAGVRRRIRSRCARGASRRPRRSSRNRCRAIPSVVRDVAILVDDTLSAETVRGTIRSAGPPTLVDVREFDRYQGKGIPDGKVSLALRLTFQAADRTLTDAEVHAAMDAIVAALARDLGAVQTIAGRIAWLRRPTKTAAAARGTSNPSIDSKRKSSCSSASSDACAASRRGSSKTTPGCSAKWKRCGRA